MLFLLIMPIKLGNLRKPVKEPVRLTLGRLVLLAEDDRDKEGANSRSGGWGVEEFEGGITTTGGGSRRRGDAPRSTSSTRVGSLMGGEGRGAFFIMGAVRTVLGACLTTVVVGAAAGVALTLRRIVMGICLLPVTTSGSPYWALWRLTRRRTGVVRSRYLAAAMRDLRRCSRRWITTSLMRFRSSAGPTRYEYSKTSCRPMT